MLTLRIKKKSDGTGALSCVRADGTATWQSQRAGHAQFFALHDLTHYAVESVLGYRLGFFGLVASGWSLEDFGSPWPRGPIPAEADPSELIVGLLDAERAAGDEWSAEEFNRQARLAPAALGADAAGPRISDDQLAAIRTRRAELFTRWEGVPPGESLVLSFNA